MHSIILKNVLDFFENLIQKKIEIYFLRFSCNFKIKIEIVLSMQFQIKKTPCLNTFTNFNKMYFTGSGNP